MTHISLRILMATLVAFALIEEAAASRHATGRERVRSTKRFTPELAEQIIRIAREEGLDPFLTLEVMRVESNFNRLARSPKGAMGLMQMIPPTAMRFGVNDPYNPEQAIRGGCRYLRFLYNRYGGRLELVLAAYNAGEGAVDRYGRRVPPYRETRGYVASVMRGYKRAKQIEEAVLGRKRGPDARPRYVISRKNPRPHTQTTLKAGQLRARLGALQRIPNLGRISEKEANR